MTNQHPIENLMRSTMENLRDMIDVNTVIGNPIQTGDGSCIVPISKVAFGFASGGSEFGAVSKIGTDKEAKHPFGGGSGAGVTVKPVAFLILRGDSVRLVPVDQNNTYDRIVDAFPQLLDMARGFFKSSYDECDERAVDKDDDICDVDSSSNNMHS